MREWFSEYIRYVVLVIALVLVIILGVIGVKAVNMAGKSAKAPEEKAAEVPADPDATAVNEPSAAPAEAQAQGLVMNDAAILTVMTSYYAAKTNKDIDTLVKLEPSVSSEEHSQNIENNSYIEGYSNIKTYSAAGTAPGSALVYVCYEGKVQNINTMVPSLTQYYLKTDETGSYYIADVASDPEVQQFIEKMNAGDEVQSLIGRVNEECERAKAMDPVLKDFMARHSNSQDSSEEEAPAEETQSVDMVAIESCNVRTEPNTDSDANIIGGLNVGDYVTKTADAQDGWVKIDFNGQEAYVMGEFLMTEEEYEEQGGDDYFSPEYYDIY